ncbi:melanocortin receptor 4-like [Montipora capricornis]|uniref:melanocortin receptor 4-like n=1 Tax=Montipora capricornis TaxID=246305 RepID=UPI0035F1B6B8
MSSSVNSTILERKPFNYSDSEIREDRLIEPGALLIFTILCTLVSLFGCAGNSLVMLAVLKSESLRSVPDFFISSLAFSDFTVCLVYLPLTIFYYNNLASPATDQDSPLPIVRSFLGHCSLVASVNNMFAVTVDRVIAIRLPLKYPSIMTIKPALSAISFVWLIAVTYGALYAPPNTISRSIVYCHSLTLMLCTMSMYAYLYFIARRQENKIQTLSSFSQSQRKAVTARQISEKKAAKTIFTIVGIYALCWLPLMLLPIFVNHSKKPILFRKCFAWVQVIKVCNSALNPYVYCLRCHKYRREFAKLLHIKVSEFNIHSASAVNSKTGQCSVHLE